MQNSIRYGTLIAMRGRLTNGLYAQMDDAAHETLDGAMKEAAHFYEDENAQEYVLGIFSVDLKTGDIKQVHNRDALVRLLDEAKNAAEQNDRDIEAHENSERFNGAIYGLTR